MSVFSVLLAQSKWFHFFVWSWIFTAPSLFICRHAHCCTQLRSKCEVVGFKLSCEHVCSWTQRLYSSYSQEKSHLDNSDVGIFHFHEFSKNEVFFYHSMTKAQTGHERFDIFQQRASLPSLSHIFVHRCRASYHVSRMLLSTSRVAQYYLFNCQTIGTCLDCAFALGYHVR